MAMKLCTCSYIWWNGIGGDIEMIARKFDISGEMQKHRKSTLASLWQLTEHQRPCCACGWSHISRCCPEDGGKPWDSFVSKKIREFYKRNGIKHITATHTTLQQMGKHRGGPGTLTCRISRFLFKQHAVCYTKGKEDPPRLMFRSALPSPLSVLKPAKDKPKSM